jgi:hypothetical protein
MPEPPDHSLFRGYLTSKDDKLRSAAVEGLGRLNDPADKSVLEQMWKDEGKIAPRLAAAFALVNEGDLSLTDEAPLRYLINTLNSAAYKDVASAYLVESARNANVRNALYAPMEQGTRDEKIGLSRVFAASGDGASIPYLEKLSRDQDSEVAQEGLRALRSLRARLKV